MMVGRDDCAQGAERGPAPQLAGSQKCMRARAGPPHAQARRAGPAGNASVKAGRRLLALPRRTEMVPVYCCGGLSGSAAAMESPVGVTGAGEADGEGEPGAAVGEGEAALGLGEGDGTGVGAGAEPPPNTLSP